jgi:phosphoglycolate phosphatase
MPAHPGTVIFDLDGTLVDTALDLHATLNHVLTRHGRAQVLIDEVRRMVGDGARALVHRGFSATGGLPDDGLFEQAVADFFTYYTDHVADRSKPFPGVVEQLVALSEQGFALGVCTNKAQGFSDKLLSEIDLAKYFSAVVGGDALTVKKPDGRHILGTLEKMGASTERAIMIGDSANDVNSARNAGVPVVVVSFGYTQIPAADLGADALIDHFDQLPEAINQVLAG